jgi:hypothetical protein
MKILAELLVLAYAAKSRNALRFIAAIMKGDPK